MTKLLLTFTLGVAIGATAAIAGLAVLAGIAQQRGLPNHEPVEEERVAA